MIKRDDKRYFTNAGNPIQPVYSPKVKADGTIELKVSGKKDIQEYIQSFADSCDINVIISRINNGELDLLNSSKGMYADFTNMPKTYAEVLQMQIDARNMFGKLDPKIQAEFNNDVNQFLASAGSEEFFKKLGVDKVIESMEKVNDVKAESEVIDNG